MKADIDIFSIKPGDRVAYSFPNNGYESHQLTASKYLNLNQVYIVSHVKIDNWHTDINLEDYPNIAFNSVMFSKPD